MNDDKAQSNLAVLVKSLKDNFYPVLVKDLYTQLAKEHKIRYDCYRKEGFTMVEALRLTVGFYD